MNRFIKTLSMSLLLALTFSSAVNASPTDDTTASTMGTIYVGDDRMAGMKNSVTAGSNEIFQTDSNGTLAWFKDSGISGVKSVMELNSSITKWSIVINLGSKDIDKADDYYSEYNKLFSGDWKGYDVYLVSVNPVDSSKYSGTLTNDSIESFNNKLKTVPNVKSYIDTYTDLKSNLKTDDSGYLLNSTSNQSMYDKIKKFVGAEVLTDVKSDSEKEQSDNIKQAMNTPFGSEDSIPGINKEQEWKDKEVDLPDDSGLSSTEKRQIAQWGEDIKSNSESSVVTKVRTGVAFVGIVIVVYFVFLYFFFLFDRVNIFFEFSLLSIATLGKLGVSDDYESTYFNDRGSSRKKYVNSRDMLVVVFIGIALGIFLISGTLYQMIGFLLQFFEWLASIF